MNAPYREPRTGALAFTASAARGAFIDRDAALRPGVRPWETMGIAVVATYASYFLAPAELATSANVMNVLLWGQVAFAVWLWRRHYHGRGADVGGPRRGSIQDDGVRLEGASGAFEHWSWDQVVSARLSPRALTLVLRGDQTFVLTRADNPDAPRIARLIASRARGPAWGPCRAYAVLAVAHVVLVSVALVSANGPSSADAAPSRALSSPIVETTTEPVSSADPLAPVLDDEPGPPDPGSATSFLREWLTQLQAISGREEDDVEAEQARDLSLLRVLHRLLDDDAFGRATFGLAWDTYPDDERGDVGVLFPWALVGDERDGLLAIQTYEVADWREITFADCVVVETRAHALDSVAFDLDFWMHRVDGQWRAFDVVANGESMLYGAERPRELRRTVDEEGWDVLVRAARALAR